MSDEQFQLVLTALFDGPVIALALIYCVMSARSYRQRGGTRAFRAFLVSVALLASVIAGPRLIPSTNELGAAVFAGRVIVFSLLVTVISVWLRDER